MPIFRNKASIVRIKSKTPPKMEHRAEDGIDICENPENTSDNSGKDPSAEEEVQDS